MGVVARYSTLILANSPTNCGVHLAESPFQTRFGMYQKNHFRDLHTLLYSIFFLNLTAIVRYDNLILVKAPQIVTYILQKAF
nr:MULTISPECIES: DUF6783 domain-containing protein [Blautia]